MKKSKVAVERYDMYAADINKVLDLDATQKVTDIVLSAPRAGAGGWGLTFTVETTVSTVVEVPTYVEK